MKKNYFIGVDVSKKKVDFSNYKGYTCYKMGVCPGRSKTIWECTRLKAGNCP